MSSNTTQLDSGTVLLAEPFMLDPNFKRTAVLLCEHGEDGTVGFIMNRPLDMRVNELMEGFPEFDAQVFYGGPVSTDTIHYVHSKGDILDNSELVSPGVYWGGDFDKLKFLISSQLIEPEHIRFFVGYSGWSKGQLEDEMNIGSWLTAKMSANYLFNSRPDHLWKKVMYNKGDTYTVIAQMSEAISWN